LNIRRHSALARRGSAGEAGIIRRSLCDGSQPQLIFGKRHSECRGVQTDHIVERSDRESVVGSEIERDSVVIFRHKRDFAVTSGACALISWGGAEDVDGVGVDLDLNVVDAAVLTRKGAQNVHLHFGHNVPWRSGVGEGEFATIPVGLVRARIFSIRSTLAAERNAASESERELVGVATWRRRRRRRRGRGGRESRLVAIRGHVILPTAIVRR